ncbi:GntR family transcriptional regulator [Novosphingobium malaysiense]|uniref:GntR family transcriptional regulator n=1 Tax=Novosphingobium malaysiense TaxID=1348853 RepID=UPI00068938BA|nr:GntR family transcriptional regulator [Novosphingobium malaysiense]
MASSIPQTVGDDSPYVPREALEAGPVPLYYQLEQRLRDRIHDGEFAKGDPLPTEDRICHEYGVSRITVRRALAGLQQQGLIERRRGVGSFVSEKPRGINSHLTGSLNEFLAVAGSLTTRPISFEEKVPPKDIQHSFSLEDGEKAVLLTTVGSLDEGPTAYLEIWFRPEIGLQLSPDQLCGRVPVVRLVEQVANVQITRAEQTIKPARAGKQAGKHLGIDADSPVLKVKRSYYAGSRLIEVANVVYHPERYSYAIEFKG